MSQATSLASNSTQQICYLGVKSQYSLVDGSIQLDDYLEHMETLGHRYVALIDNGGLFGAFDFYSRCRARQMIPIVGATMYVRPSPALQQLLQRLAPRNIRRRTVNDDIVGKLMSTMSPPPAFHLSFLARNNQGYRVLTRMVSEAYRQELTDDLPVCSWEFVSAYLQQDTVNNLLVLSGGVHSELTYQILLAQQLTTLPSELSHYQDSLYSITRKYINELQALMGSEGFYLELFDHNLGYEAEVTAELIRLGEDLDVPLLAAPAVYYLQEEDLETHLIALAIKNSLAEAEIQSRRRDVAFHMPSEATMYKTYGAVKGAIGNTMKVAEACAGLGWETSSYHLPSFPVPSSESGITVDEWLEQMARRGLQRRLEPLSDMTASAQYEQRLEYELEVIKKMGFSGYFLIVQDFIRWAKEQHIPVGPGRGSGAGSLIAYSIGITDIDPLRWGLLFERFLNPERVSLPDFDIDFCQWRREEVIGYVIQKYGQDKVAHICSFGKLMAKAALKSVARVMGVHFLKMNALTKMFPDDMSLSLSEVLASTPSIAEEVNKDDTISRAMTVALKLEGMVSHTSIHPAGVVIADRPIIDYVPTFMTSRDQWVMSQYEMKSLEKSGLVKFDFLGLKTLTVIAYACDEISKTKQSPFQIREIPLDDQQIFQQLSCGHTVGIFQAESMGMTALVRKLRPSHFEDIIALVALFRPGPLGSGMVDDFIERKHKRQPITYLHPLLKPLLHETYGMIVYQEQVQKIASSLAHYSLGEADLLRRAMGKKIAEEMQQQQQRFVQGAQKEGIEQELAVKIFDLMAEFAKYGFNKSHSAAYGLILYQTAYLKTHYPAEFMLALMNSDIDNPKKIAVYIDECTRLGIVIVPPALNRSHSLFVLNEGKIVYALNAIKGISKKSLASVLAERDKRVFADLLDFACRCQLQQFGQKNLELLNNVGVFDEFGYGRAQIKAQIPKLMVFSAHYHAKCHNSQPSLLTLVAAESDDSHNTQPADGYMQTGQVQGGDGSADAQGSGLHSFSGAPEWYRQLIENPVEQHQRIKLADLIVEKGLLGTYQSAHPLSYFQALIPLLEPSATILELRQSAKYQRRAHRGGGGDHRLVMFLEHQFETTLKSGQRVLRLALESCDEDGVSQRVEGVMYEQDLAKHAVIPKNHRLVVVTGYLRDRNYNYLVIRTIEDALDKLCREPMDVIFECTVNSLEELETLARTEVELLQQLSEFCRHCGGDAHVALVVSIRIRSLSGDHESAALVKLYFDLTAVDQRSLVNKFLLNIAFEMGGFKVRKDYRPRD